ncbi:hypothetical protein ACOBV8_18195 (plasmid) [Pseudoalteromonas espejiana]
MAYLPNFVIDDLGLTKLTVKGLTDHYSESIVMIYKPSKADGWLNKHAHFINGLKNIKRLNHYVDALG